MRLRSWVVAMTALLTATVAMADNGYPSRTGGNYSGPRWYGYFGNDGHVPENFDHTNFTQILATPVESDRGQQVSDATARILAELAVARECGERAMVDLGAIVFIPTGTNQQPYYNNNPNAAADFLTLVQTLVSNGYLVPNAPESGTVSSFYVADEPDGNGLGDVVDGTGAPIPNPALLNAINAIRQNPDTTNFPLAATVTEDKYADMVTGSALDLFDWVGLDDYHNGVTTYLNDFWTFENTVLEYDRVGGTPLHFYLVPLVSDLGSSYSAPYSGGASSLNDYFVAHPSVIGIMPFQWDHTVKNADGTVTHEGMVGKTWAPSYIALGKSIVPASPLSPPGNTVVADFAILH